MCPFPRRMSCLLTLSGTSSKSAASSSLKAPMAPPTECPCTPILSWCGEKCEAFKGLTARQMKDFDAVQMKWMTANAVIRYYALLPQTLKYAVRIDFIPVNLEDKVDWSRKNSIQPGFYDRAEINRILAAVSGLLIEALVKPSVFYGLRGSAVLGLKGGRHRL